MHSAASAIPTLVALLASQIVIWSCFFAARAAQRANGRRAVEAELKRLGETAATVETVPLPALAGGAGLSGGCVFFQVASRAADGAARSHLWAYESGLISLRSPGGLKRLAHGIWIPA
jgi:hypothetical protein